MKKIILLLIPILSLSGCVTPPANYPFDKSRTYNQSKDKTWEKLMEYFTSKNIPIKNIEKASGIVYAENMFGGQETELYADCGQQGLTQIVNSKFEVNVFVRAKSPSKSTATVNLNIVAVKQFGNSPPITVSCNSKGIAETRILDSLK